MEVDEALNLLGKWNKWQMLFYVMLGIADTFPAAWHMLAIVFIGGQEDHHCKLFDGAVVNESIPYKDGMPAKCEMYESPGKGNDTISCNGSYHYYGDSGNTIVSEWGLVCEHSYLIETSQTVMIFGVMVGAMGFSALSDMFGRKPVFLFSQMAMVVVGVTTAFVTNYYLFVCLRFIAGALQQGIILTGFVMACELFPAEQRTFAGMAIENFWALGMCLLAFFAYLVRSWNMLQLLISIPGILTIAFFWILPESIVWLAANDRVDEAETILKNAAKFNKVDMPEHPLRGPEVDQFQTDKNDAPEANNQNNQKQGFLARLKPKKKAPQQPGAAPRYTLLDVMKHPRLRMNAIIMCALWFVNSLVYYGLSLSTAALAGDRYLNFFLSGLVEIPAYTSCIFILQKFGRRVPLAVFHIVAGVALVITLIIPDEIGGFSMLWLTILFNMIGKFGITGSFGTVFLYAPEIFPTTLRNQAMGLSSVGGRLGNMIAPFSSFVARVVAVWLPGLVFGVLSIGVGFLVFLLPETLNKPLPQTIEDIEAWSKSSEPSVFSKLPCCRGDRGAKHEMVDIGNDLKEGAA